MFSSHSNASKLSYEPAAWKLCMDIHLTCSEFPILEFHFGFSSPALWFEYIYEMPEEYFSLLVVYLSIDERSHVNVYMTPL